MDKDTIERLWYAETYMGYNEFYICFSDKGDNIEDQYGISRHLWNKFTGYNHSILRLWRTLDLNNQQKLLNYLNSDEFNTEYTKGMCL